MTRRPEMPAGARASVDPATRSAPARASREEEAQRTLARTAVSRRVAWLACGAFLLTAFSELAVQHAVEIPRNIRARQDEIQKTGAARTSLLPRAYQVIDLLPSADQVRAVRSFSQAWDLLNTRDRIQQYTDSLKDASELWQRLSPYTQVVLTGLLGGGGNDVCVGRDGWLFYRPDLDYVIGQPFLDSSVLQRRQQSAGLNAAVDPRPAIIDFAHQLRARDIGLIVLPVPSKACIHPERLSSSMEVAVGAVQNASFGQFKQDLESAGVLVFDPAEAMGAVKADRAEAFLRTDSHWRPEAVELVASRLAEFLRRKSSLPEGTAAYRRDARTVRNLGDIARMLRLPVDCSPWTEESITIHPVTDPAGRPWRPDKRAGVLILGDSYANIYSVDGMGWGSSAGLAEQISFELQRPVDRLSRNDAGAWASRAMLSDAMAQGDDRLAGKKVVIWEFAVRELSEGDWKVIPLGKQ